MGCFFFNFLALIELCIIMAVRGSDEEISNVEQQAWGQDCNTEKEDDGVQSTREKCAKYLEITAKWFLPLAYGVFLVSFVAVAYSGDRGSNDESFTQLDKVDMQFF